jgi:peptidoglycan/LPS O-acetylase OafA/YrhL
MTPNTSSPRYFFSLDAIRGFAALIVVLCHWQFFFYKNDALLTVPLEDLNLPLFRYLSIFYMHAPFAVDLFFLLSGFIFFWFYADKIASGKTNFGTFFGFRMTRLYPVHIITLIAAALVQFWMLRINGHTFIIQNNDTYHFILNLLLIHTWGFEITPALNGFNGPSWSVSIEVLLYLLFFIVAKRRLQHNKPFLFFMLVVGAVIQALYSMVGQGIYSFFLGGLTYHLYNWISLRKDIRKITTIVTVTAFLLWFMILTEYSFSYIRNTFMWICAKALPNMSTAVETSVFNLARNTFFRTIISPVSILMLALLETTRGSLKAKWAIVLGHSSYALYLLHFPLMVLSVILVDTFGISRDVYYSPYTMLLFYAVLIPLSIVVHYYFELPVQETLRRKLLKAERKPVVVPAAQK